MFEAPAIEFPFVDAMPRREKSKVAKVWDLVKQMRTISEREGLLIPLVLTAKCLNVSPTRVYQLVAEERLKRVTIDEHVFITENSVVDFAKEERKNGRPPNFSQGLVQSFRDGMDVVKRR